MTVESGLLYALAECQCHVWVVLRYEKLGKCGRCDEIPVVLPGPAPENAKTVCKHEGECRKV